MVNEKVYLQTRLWNLFGWIKFNVAEPLDDYYEKVTGKPTRRLQAIVWSIQKLFI